MLGAGCMARVLYSPSCLNSFGVLCGAMCRMFGHLHHQAAAVCVCVVCCMSIMRSHVAAVTSWHVLFRCSSQCTVR